MALPDLGEELGVGTGARAWVLAAFSLSFAICTAIFGRLGDLRGLRAPLRAGIVLFTAGSVVAAAAPSFGVLIAGRLLQGAGAGAVPVLALGVLAATFEEEARGAALGALTAVVSIVSGSGPLIGGGLEALVSWRAVLGLPALSILLMEPVARLAPDRAEDAHGALDVRGAALVAVTVSGLIVLLQVPATGAGPVVVALAAAALLLGGVLLARHVRARPEGVVHRDVATNGPFVLAAVAATGMLAAYLGLIFAVPQVLSATFGWSALRIGVTLLPAAAVGALASRWVGRHAAQLGRYRVGAVLAAVAAAGLLLAAAGAPRALPMVLGLACGSAAFSAGQVALIDAIPLLVEERVRGAALGLFNLVFFVGGAIGSAWTGGLSGPLGFRGALGTLAVLPALGALALVRARSRVRTAALV